MIKNKLNLAVLFGFCALPISVFSAESYQHDASLIYSDSSEDGYSDSINLSYRYYSDMVAEDDRPFLLTGYLHQGTNIGGSYQRIDGDDSLYNVSGKYVFDSKLFFSFGYKSADLKSSAGSGSDSDSYAIGGGYYLNPTSSVFVSYERNSTDSQFNSFESSSFSRYSLDVDTFTVGVDSYFTFDKTEGLYIKGHYSYIDYEHESVQSSMGQVSRINYSEDRSTVGILSDWYITKSWSVGASYIRDFEVDDDTWLMQSGYYLPINESVAATFSIATNLDSDVDGVFYSLGVNGRF